jgi:hypothetical protein
MLTLLHHHHTAVTAQRNAAKVSGPSTAVPVHVVLAVVGKIRDTRDTALATALPQVLTPVPGVHLTGPAGKEDAFVARRTALVVQESGAAALHAHVSSITSAVSILEQRLVQMRIHESACAQVTANLGGPWTDAKRAEVERERKAAIHECLVGHESILELKLDEAGGIAVGEGEAAAQEVAQAQQMKAHAEGRLAAAKTGKTVEAADPALVQAGLAGVVQRKEAGAAKLQSVLAAVAKLPTAPAALPHATGGAEGTAAHVIIPELPPMPAMPVLAPAPVAVPSKGAAARALSVPVAPPSSPPKPLSLATAFHSVPVDSTSAGGGAASLPAGRGGRARKGTGAGASVANWSASAVPAHAQAEAEGASLTSVGSRPAKKGRKGL